MEPAEISEVVSASSDSSSEIARHPEKISPAAKTRLVRAIPALKLFFIISSILCNIEFCIIKSPKFYGKKSMQERKEREYFVICIFK